MRVIFRLFLSVLITLLSASSLHASAIYSEHFVLPNGLEVVVIPNHRVPAVSHMLWYKVGAIDEPTGKSGIAHFLEHLMFKGTKTSKPGDFSAKIAKNGGNDNAFTSFDFTAYFQNIAVDKLPLVMGMEANRMQNLIFDNEEILKERDVIIEERSMRVDNKPASVLAEQMRAALYLHHPYGTPLIGWRHEIEALTKEDAERFYRKYYAPNNAVLIVAGDITAKKLKPLAEKYYGVLPRGESLERLVLQDPEPVAERRIILRDGRVKKPEITRYYLAPTQTAGQTQHAYALTVLAHIMGGTDTSRLYQALVVDKSLAASAYSYYDDLGLYKGIFAVKIVPNDSKEIDEAEEAADAVLAEIVAQGVTDEELQRAKDMLKAESIYARDGFRTLAYAFGQALTVGMPMEYVTNWDREIENVSKDDILAAAQYILKKERSVIGILLPKEEE